MNLIAAVDNNWGIGKNGDLLVSLPEDQKGTFRACTYGGTVVYGRKTLATFPKGRLLPGRKNIVLSRDPLFYVEGATVLHSIEDVLLYEKEHPEESIWIIGGAEIYQAFLPYSEEAVITHIDHAFDADAYFPDLSKLKDWSRVCVSPVVHSEKGLDFVVTRYRRRDD
jgi:dihydrofolate reductase